MAFVAFDANFMNLLRYFLVDDIEVESWVIGIWRFANMLCKKYYGRSFFAGF